MMGARRGRPLSGGSPASGGRRMEPSPLHSKNQAAEPQVRPAGEPSEEARPQSSGLPDGVDQRLLQFEKVLTELSGRFVHLPAAQIDSEIESALRLTVESMGVDRCTLFELSEEESQFRVTHSWEAEGIEPTPSVIPTIAFPWVTERLLRGELTKFARPEDLPASASLEKESYLRAGLKAQLIVPLEVGETVFGALAFCSFRSEKSWPDEMAQRMRLVAEVFANALMRQKIEERLLAERKFSESVIESMPGFFFMLDDQGRYLRWNKKVESLMGYPASEMLERTVGFRVSPEDRPRIAEGLEEVFRRGHGSLEYDFLTQDGRKIPYYANAKVVHIGGKDHLVCMAIDISGRKQAEDALLEAFSEIKQLKEQLRAECTYLQEEIKLEHNFENIIGQSDPLKYVLFKIEQVAPTDATVLILGETGTGKELVARSIHSGSPRKNRPLVKVDCAALPSNLIESELFGHEKGAFTSAHGRRVGRFELAHGGTIFLDEVAELPLALQSKLLRVIQEGEFERLGSSQTIKVDVRIIAATNRHLQEEVQARRFREDLWYRLNVFPITVPPLRNRKEDIPLLAHFFVAKFGKRLGRSIRALPPNVMESLGKYHWPGNVREFENVIERAVICTQGAVLTLADQLDAPAPARPSSPSGRSLTEVEREHILQALHESRWQIEGEQGAAALLGLNPSTLRGRMRKLGIRRP